MQDGSKKTLTVQERGNQNLNYGGNSGNKLKYRYKIYQERKFK